MPARLHAQHREPGLPLDKREHVPLPVRPAEHHQVALPMAERAALSDFGRALREGILERDRHAAGLARIALAPTAALARQELIEVLLASDIAVDEPVDGLVAQACGAGLTPKPAGDLLRRPSLLQAGDHVPRQVRILMQLAPAAAPPLGARLSRLREVAAQPGAVVVPVAPDLAVNCRAMSTEALGDPGYRHLRFA